MPNLKIQNLNVNCSTINQPVLVDFDIINDGIWTINAIKYTIICNPLGNILSEYKNDSINLAAGTTTHISVQITTLTTKGIYEILVIIDPNNLINETYSNLNGSIRTNPKADNSQTQSIQLLSGNPIEDFLDRPNMIIFLSMGTIGAISLGIVLKKKVNNLKEINKSKKLLKSKFIPLDELEKSWKTEFDNNTQPKNDQPYDPWAEQNSNRKTDNGWN
jgi:hypothetical protein